MPVLLAIAAVFFSGVFNSRAVAATAKFVGMLIIIKSLPARLSIAVADASTFSLDSVSISAAATSPSESDGVIISGPGVPVIIVTVS